MTADSWQPGYGSTFASRSTSGVRLSRRDLLDSACERLDMRKPWNAPKWVWRGVWLLGNWLTQHLLHRLDPVAPVNTKVREDSSARAA